MPNTKQEKDTFASICSKIGAIDVHLLVLASHGKMKRKNGGFLCFLPEPNLNVFVGSCAFPLHIKM